MEIVSAQGVTDKTVLLRFDLDVPLQSVKSGDYVQTEEGSSVLVKYEVADDFRLIAGLETLRLCLDHATSVVMFGHLGRPEGEDSKLSVAPVVEWFVKKFGDSVELEPGKLHILENLRFEKGEEACDINFAHEIIHQAKSVSPNSPLIFINEAFAAHHPAASTTILPALLPHAAGLRFAKEVQTLTTLRNNPKRPLVAIIGGAKIEDKLAAIESLSRLAEHVLVGGKLIKEIQEKSIELPPNVIVGQLDERGFDISHQTIDRFQEILSTAAQVVWAGPVGKFEDGFDQGNKSLAHSIIISGADSIIGGGDTIHALQKLNLLEKFNFVSVGGGAMLKLLSEGTLPTIQALN